MLLQRLREYAEERMSLPPPMYSEQPIRYFFALKENGQFLTLRDTADKNDKALSGGISLFAPHVKRSSKVRPKLLADNSEYVLGLSKQKSNPDRVQQQHARFVALVNECARETGEPSVSSVVHFLESLDVSELGLPTDFDRAATITFEVGESLVRPIDLPSVREYWSTLNGPDEEKESAGARLPCIGCGRVRSTLERHPLKIYGVPGGRSDKDLVSANQDAFLSYGLKASLNSPVCLPCAEAYGNALNELLRNPDTHLLTKESAYAFWTRRPAKFLFAKMISEPENQQVEVRSVLLAHRTGRSASVEFDPNPFYAVGLGASVARLVVRDWIDTTVGEAQRRLGRYFALQELVGWDGSPWEPVALSRLADSTVHNPKNNAPPPIISLSLIRLAMNGTPLPLDLLYMAVQRNRAKQDVTRERAMLIKMVLQSQPDIREGEERSMANLNENHPDEAYHYGRLLEVLDEIQYAALNSVNSSVTDKYYGAASSAPGSVFGTLIHNAQHHLGKLRGDQSKHGAYVALDKKMRDVMGHISGFDQTLSLPRQGVFALGFYHQRATRFSKGSSSAPAENGGDAPTA